MFCAHVSWGLACRLLHLLSIFSQNYDGRKEECNLFLFLDEEVYDPLYSSKSSVVDQTFSCSTSQGVCCISLKEVRLHDIAQGSLPSECQMDFQSSSQLLVWKQGLDLDLNHPKYQSHKLMQLDMQYQWKLKKKQMKCFYLPQKVVVESALVLKMT